MTTANTTTPARDYGTVAAMVGMVQCSAHGGRPGSECYYSLAMDPPCGETPCMIEPGRTICGVHSYKRRIHPNSPICVNHRPQVTP